MRALASMSVVLGDITPGMSGWQQNDIVAALLILVLGMALGIGVVCLLLVLHYMRGGQLTIRRASWPLSGDVGERRIDHPFLFMPQRWLAIRSGNLNVIQTALRLSKPTPCSWEEGLSAAQEKKLFISPPINGWVLVMGSHLPDPGDDVDRCYHFLVELSRKVGQVQFFSANRVVNHHAWVQVQHGVVQRAYAWTGRTVWNQGRKTNAELDLGLRCFDYADVPEGGRFAQAEPLQQNTERVCLLAARWSIDPATVDARRLRESRGLTGEVSRSKAH